MKPVACNRGIESNLLGLPPPADGIPSQSHFLFLCLRPLVAFVLLSACSFAALSQDGTTKESAGKEADARSPWSLGVGVIASDSPYAGEASRVIPVPLISYQGDRFYARGVGVGYEWIQSESLQVDLVAKYRFAAFEADELGRAELAANGIDRDQLEDRDGGLDLGVATTWRGKAGALELELLADASGASDGQEVKVQYSYPIPLGYGRLSPSVGLRWLSKDLANYQYGTLPGEVARGVTAYRPGSAIVPELGLSLAHPLSRNWYFVGLVRHSALPNKIEQSPLIEAGVNSETSLLMFFTRGF